MNVIDDVRQRLIELHDLPCWGPEDVDAILAPLAEKIVELEKELEWQRNQFYTLSTCVGEDAREAVECWKFIERLTDKRGTSVKVFSKHDVGPASVVCLGCWAGLGWMFDGDSHHAALKAAVEAMEKEKRDE